MQYIRIGGSTYPKDDRFTYNSQGEINLVIVKNDEEIEKLLTSITLSLGKAASGKNASAAAGDSILNCNGNAFTGWLYYGENKSTTNYITNECALKSNAYWDYTSNMRNYTFTFKTPISIKPGNQIILRWSSDPLTAANKNNKGPVLVIASDKSTCTGTAQIAAKDPTITISTEKYYTIYNETNKTRVNISANTSGDNTPTTTKLIANGKSWTTSLGNSGGPVDYTPSYFEVSDGQSYDVYASRTHSNTNKTVNSNHLTMYTYRTPKISSLSANPKSFSGTGNSTLKWYTNGRRWATTNENNFTTTLKLNGTTLSATNNPNTGDSTNKIEEQSYELSLSDINKCFTTTQRSQESISTSFSVVRRNPSSGIEVSSSLSGLTIQFWPKYPVTNIKYSNTKDNSIVSPGSTQYLDILPEVKVEWSYSTLADAGIVDGYRIRIYRADKTTLVTTTTSTTKSKIFNTRTDLKRGELNYICIEPYYNLPNNTRYKIWTSNYRIFYNTYRKNFETSNKFSYNE